MDESPLPQKYLRNRRELDKQERMAGAPLRSAAWEDNGLISENVFDCPQDCLAVFLVFLYNTAIAQNAQ